MITAEEFVLARNAWALVVEDDALNLVAITNLLKELNVQYKRNTTGQDVLAQARTMQPMPDVILLDMDLPYGTPYTICTGIRSDEALSHIPVVGMGNEDWLRAGPEMKACGFTAFIAKPLLHKQFREILCDILENPPCAEEQV